METERVDAAALATPSLPAPQRIIRPIAAATASSTSGTPVIRPITASTASSTFRPCRVIRPIAASTASSIFFFFFFSPQSANHSRLDSEVVSAVLGVFWMFSLGGENAGKRIGRIPSKNDTQHWALHLPV